LINDRSIEFRPPDVTLSKTLANKAFGWLNFRNKKRLSAFKHIGRDAI